MQKLISCLLVANIIIGCGNSDPEITVQNFVAGSGKDTSLYSDFDLFSFEGRQKKDCLEVPCITVHRHENRISSLEVFLNDSVYKMKFNYDTTSNTYYAIDSSSINIDRTLKRTIFMKDKVLSLYMTSFPSNSNQVGFNEIEYYTELTPTSYNGYELTFSFDLDASNSTYLKHINSIRKSGDVKLRERDDLEWYENRLIVKSREFDVENNSWLEPSAECYQISNRSLFWWYYFRKYFACK